MSALKMNSPRLEKKKISHFRRKDAFRKALCWPHLWRAGQLSIYSPVQGQISPRRVFFSRCGSLRNICWSADSHTEQTHQRSVVPLLVLGDISCGSIPVLMEILLQNGGSGAFCGCDPPFQPSSRKEDPTLRNNFLCCVWAAPFPPGNTLTSSFLFHGVKRSQILPGAYSSRYFYSPHVLAHTLVWRQPHLALKLTFQAVNKALLHPQEGGVTAWIWGSWQCFTVIQSTQIYALGWKKLCQSSPSWWWPAVQGRLRHTCPAKVNKRLRWWGWISPPTYQHTSYPFIQ